MHTALWFFAALLLVGGAGSLWYGLTRKDAGHPLGRSESLAGIIGLLAGSGKIVDEYWSTALGMTLLAAAAVVSVVLILRLVMAVGRAKDA